MLSTRISLYEGYWNTNIKELVRIIFVLNISATRELSYVRYVSVMTLTEHFSRQKLSLIFKQVYWFWQKSTVSSRSILEAGGYSYDIHNWLANELNYVRASSWHSYLSRRGVLKKGEISEFQGGERIGFADFKLLE